MKRRRSLDNLANGNNITDPAINKPLKKGKQRATNSCYSCKLPCDKDLVLQCYVCNKNAHLKCLGIPDKNAELVLELIGVIGWACNECKTLIQVHFNKANSLDTQIKHLTQEVAALKSTIGDTKGTQTAGKRNAAGPSQAAGSTSDRDILSTDTPNISQPPQGWTEVRRTITAEVMNTFRRRRNVIVSGLSDPGNASSDQSTFLKLCMTYLNIKPNIISTKRLGQPGTSDSNRRLLVVLSTDEEASKIIQVARNLRNQVIL